MAESPAPDSLREIQPWTINVPRSAVVDLASAEKCRVYVEDGQHWMDDGSGAIPLIVLRAERVRLVDDAATDLAVKIREIPPAACPACGAQSVRAFTLINRPDISECEACRWVGKTPADSFFSEDTKRLNWFEAWTKGDQTICPPGNHGGDPNNWLVSLQDDLRGTRLSSWCEEYEGTTLRDAIDAARAATPTSPEEPSR